MHIKHKKTQSKKDISQKTQLINEYAKIKTYPWIYKWLETWGIKFLWKIEQDHKTVD